MRLRVTGVRKTRKRLKVRRKIDGGVGGIAMTSSLDESSLVIGWE